MERFEPQSRRRDAILEPALLARADRRDSRHLRVHLTRAGSEQDLGGARNAKAERACISRCELVAQTSGVTAEPDSPRGAVRQVDPDDSQSVDLGNALLELRTDPS